MASYLLVFRGGSMPETDAERGQVMKAWTDWFTALGPAVKDGGNPTSQTRTLSADGTSTPGGAGAPSGYSIISADNIDQAVELAKGCPAFLGGATIDVCETFEVM